MISVHPVRDEAFRKLWSERHRYCQACGVRADKAAWPGLSVHHIIKRGRSDEACNLLKLCSNCHAAAETQEVQVAGSAWPLLPWRVCLTLKAVREHTEFHPARLAELASVEGLDMAKIPRRVEEAFRENRPWDKAHFAPDYLVGE